MKTQADIVVEVMEMLGGVASLQQLYVECAPRFPETRTPDATVRRIVQMEGRLSRLKPGLYCLKARADAVVSALYRLDGVVTFEKLHEACEQDIHVESNRLPVGAVRQIVQHDMRLHDFEDGRICLASRREEFAALQLKDPKRHTQSDEVVAKMEELGGVASVEDLYAACEPLFSNWGTKTPDATIRRIVQTDDRVSRLKFGGLYCLNTWADAVVDILGDLGGSATLEQLHEACNRGLLDGGGQLPVDTVRQIAWYDRRIHGLGDGRFYLETQREEIAGAGAASGHKRRAYAGAVVAALKRLSGTATLEQLYAECAPEFPHWGLQKPRSQVRRVVQQDARIEIIKPGLYRLVSLGEEPAGAQPATIEIPPPEMGGGKTRTQGDLVVDVLEQLGGIATLQSLYAACRPYFSSWETKTPDASIRRIVQMDERVHKLKPGLYCLKILREKYVFMDDAGLESREMYTPQKQEFNRSYYQGRILQLGRYKSFCAYAPPEDRDKVFLQDGGDTLERWVNCSDMPAFGSPAIVESAKSVDVVWFNERDMPSAFYEVAMVDDMGQSLEKFYGMQDFNADLVIVAPRFREEHFSQKTESAAFAKLRGRVEFCSTDDIEQKVDREAQRLFG